jgi:hypothetical protein
MGTAFLSGWFNFCPTKEEEAVYWTVLSCGPKETRSGRTGVWLDFGEIMAGREAQLDFSARNLSAVLRGERPQGARLSGVLVDSEVRLVGFTPQEPCVEGDLPFTVQGPLPADLHQLETVDLQLAFSPIEPGNFECEWTPEIEVIENPAYPWNVDEIVHFCRILAVGTATAGPEPECGLEPATAVIDFGEVEVGSDRWQSLTIRNETPDDIPTNQFFYAFEEGSNDCAFFTFDPPTDSSSLIGPSGSASGAKQVVTRFSPNEAREFQCSRGLITLDEPGGTEITNACTSPVMWTGTGVMPPPVPPTWAACSSETRTMDLHAVTGLSTDQVFIAGDGGVVLTPVGTASCQWQAVGTGFTEVDLRDLWLHEAGGQMAFWAVGNIPPDPGFSQETGAVLFSETVNQAGWSQIDEDDLQTFEAVWGSGFDDVYFAGLGVSTDFPNAKWYAGDPQNLEKFTISWSGMSTVTGMDGTGRNDVWAVLHESWNAVYRFSGGDPAQEWEDMTPTYAPISPLNDIWIGSGDGFDVVYAVGDAGAVYRYDRQQGQWLDPESIAGQDGDFHGVWVSPTGTVFAVGEGPMIYEGHVDEPGQWTRHTIPATAVKVGDVLFDVWGTDDENVYAVGTNGIILRYAPPAAATVASR